MSKEFYKEEYGFFRVAACSPDMKVADIEYNTNEIIKNINAACEKKASLLVFPELSLTGYTAGDLFFQSNLIAESKKAVLKICTYLKETGKNIIIVIGMPFEADNQLFNCAVILYKDRILGIVPKSFIPNYNEFYEKRWFSPASKKISKKVSFFKNGEHDQDGKYRDIPFNDKLLIEDVVSGGMIGVEICEDLWVPIPPSSYHFQNGANIVVNPSASNETVGKTHYRRELVKQQSARGIGAYVYTSSDYMESTTDLVFSGHMMIAENGDLLDDEHFKVENRREIIIRDIDLDKIKHERMKINSFMDNRIAMEYEIIEVSREKEKTDLFLRRNACNIFTVGNISEKIEDIIAIQTAGLMKRMKHTGITKLVVGVSGGLDSTLALLVSVNTLNKMKLPLENITGITMPGFGTTGRTYNNAVELIKAFGATFVEISIKDACIQHFKDIEQPEGLHDIAFENSQARERTQILMDYANKIGALVIGTGNLSESALGWATYNGDHMSMYAVNASIPKTLVRYMVTWVRNNIEEIGNKAGLILDSIVETPISPELIPADENGEIKQETEKIIGDYIIHDFFIFYVLRYGFSPTKIFFLAERAFEGIYSPEELIKWLKLFYRRFFTNQFKRSCMPDGPKVGSVSLSPRGDWRMPSDASYNLWMKECEEIEKRI